TRWLLLRLLAGRWRAIVAHGRGSVFKPYFLWRGVGASCLAASTVLSPANGREPVAPQNHVVNRHLSHMLRSHERLTALTALPLTAAAGLVELLELVVPPDPRRRPRPWRWYGAHRQCRAW